MLTFYMYHYLNKWFQDNFIPRMPCFNLDRPHFEGFVLSSCDKGGVCFQDLESRVVNVSRSFHACDGPLVSLEVLYHHTLVCIQQGDL